MVVFHLISSFKKKLLGVKFFLGLASFLLRQRRKFLD